jgi:Tfp pilus assembly protein PilX
MKTPNQTPRHRQRGMALITSMLLLIVVTIMALSMFRSYGVQ